MGVDGIEDSASLGKSVINQWFGTLASVLSENVVENDRLHFQALTVCDASCFQFSVFFRGRNFFSP